MREVNQLTVVLLFINFLFSCDTDSKNYEMEFLTKKIPNDTPLDFKEELIPFDEIIHKGTFSPDLREYYYTLSDKDFKNFTVYMIRKQRGTWSDPEKAFFNSNHDEHGMSFSPDGKSIYFSSTRPTNIEGVHETWHIWKSEKINEEWTEPIFVDIPNLREKLVSHPSITNSGTLYFHSSNLDYSEMDIYHSKQVNGKFENAEKISTSLSLNTNKCTPFISPDEDFLIFATIENQLDLLISFNDELGNWTGTKRLNEKINNFGQGNPYVTPDNQFLFFTTGEHEEKKWKVKWVNIMSELE